MDSSFTSDPGPRERRSAKAWIVRVLLPIAGSLAASAIAALLASSLGPHQSELMVVAGASAALAGILAIKGLRGQIAVRRSAFSDLRSVEARVRLSEARLRGILDSAMDAIITIDDRQEVVMFNRAAEDMFRCPRELALNNSLASFIPERLRGAHASHVRQFGETGTQTRRMGGLRIVTGLRRDGEEFPIDASISQVVEGNARFYTVILRDVSARVQAEAALRRSKEELQELAIAAHMIREQEKTRIARELHDELGQALTMLQMDVAWAREMGSPGDSAFATRLDRMAALLTSTIQATRRIAADLRPLMLDDLGLVPAIEWLVQNFSQRTGVTCELRISGPALDLPALQSSAVFRIVQESLTNIAKHAQATHADVSIDHGDGMLTIRVRDNGSGFSPDEPRKPNSFGLFGLRERAALLAGTATIDSARGRGTTVVVQLPTGALVPTTP